MSALRAGHGSRIAREHENVRRDALEGLRPALARAWASQDGVARAVRDGGGSVLSQSAIGNSLVVEVPARLAHRLARRPDVRAVEPASRHRPLGLAEMSAFVGAPAFWSGGFTGGEGANDVNPADLAIWSDDIQNDHPAFAGLDIVEPPGASDQTPCGTAASGCTHGTAVASLAVSGGASGCAECAAGDESQKGVAWGVDSLLDPASSNLVDHPSWTLGLPSGGIHGGVAGAPDPAEVVNESYGSFEPGIDDNAELQNTDRFTELGLTQAIAVGNSGPAQAASSPSIAYNAISVGAYDRNGNYDASDDQIAAFSSRGPTPAGRKKPDLVAEGIPSQYAERRWSLAGHGLWDAGLQGTSFAAPQVAGAAVLLAGSGITDVMAQKAILINSARPGRKTPADAMGTQTGWQPDWGFGALDLARAYAERLRFATDSAGIRTGGYSGSTARFFRADVAAGDPATLVWLRRTTGCVGPGCAAQPMSLTNLDLEQLSAAGSLQTASESGVDNVEQVRSPAGGSVLYKVKASSTVDELAGEPFALASRNPLTPLASPQPDVSVATSAAHVETGGAVTVTAHVANPSPDLDAEQTTATLVLPGGVALASGTATRDLGALARRGEAGDSETVTWTVRADAAGLHQMRVRAAASKYGESFRAEAVSTLRVDAAAVTPLAPPPPPAPPPPAAAPAPPPPVAVLPPRISPNVTIRRATLRRGRLVIEGRIRRGTGGRVLVTYRAKVGRRTLRVRRYVSHRAGRIQTTLRLSSRLAGARHGLLIVSYPGDLRHRPESDRATIRRPRR